MTIHHLHPISENEEKLKMPVDMPKTPKVPNNVWIIWALLFVPLMIWNSYVGSILWGWFVVPLGMRPIGVVEALGLTICLNFWIKSAIKSERTVAEFMLRTTTLPLMALAMGWIVKQFV